MCCHRFYTNGFYPGKANPEDQKLVPLPYLDCALITQFLLGYTAGNISQGLEDAGITHNTIKSQIYILVVQLWLLFMARICSRENDRFVFSKVDPYAQM